MLGVLVFHFLSIDGQAADLHAPIQQELDRRVRCLSQPTFRTHFHSRAVRININLYSVSFHFAEAFFGHAPARSHVAFGSFVHRRSHRITVAKRMRETRTRIQD
jgi:hypothetical protein